MIHSRSARLAPRWARMVGSAVATTTMSRADMNAPIPASASVQPGRARPGPVGGEPVAGPRAARRAAGAADSSDMDMLLADSARMGRLPVPIRRLAVTHRPAQPGLAGGLALALGGLAQRRHGGADGWPARGGAAPEGVDVAAQGWPDRDHVHARGYLAAAEPGHHGDAQARG